MVNAALFDQAAGVGSRDPEVALALAYAPARVRPRLRALWALDTRLADVVRTTREPMIGQMRLTWWHDALSRADPAVGEPVLAALATAGFAAATLHRIVEGWEALLEPTDAAALSSYAQGRGGGLFVAAAGVLGGSPNVADAGAGWALVDLARHHSQAVVAEQALALAATRLALAPRQWSRAGRPLGILTKLARRDLTGLAPQGSPSRLWAAAALALTGR